MKRVLFFSLLLSMVFSFHALWAADNFCQEGREVSTEHQQYCLVEKDGKEVRHGVYKEFHKNGNKKTLGEYIYGAKTGRWTAWNSKGTKVLEEDFQKGLLHGTVKKWYTNGQLAFEGHYANGKPVVQRLEWYQDGNKMAENIYTRKGDEILAKRNTWYDNGQKQSSGEYINGKLNGRETRWYKNGRKRSEYEYRNGRKNGVCRDWYGNGKEKSLNHFINAKKDGKSIEWYDNGQKKSEGAWSDGREGSWTFWKASGTIGKQVVYKNGKQLD